MKSAHTSLLLKDHYERDVSLVKFLVICLAARANFIK